MHKLLVANRGEIAVRICAAARGAGIATVGIYSDADRDAPHVDACDEAIALGGNTSLESYLAIDKVLAAAKTTGADSLHPGYGFLSENAEAARQVVTAGLTWVGPSPDVIDSMGDKTAARRIMEAAGVPVLPGRVVVDGSDLVALAAEVGFPLLVKAAAGGGGKGMRLVHAAAELPAAVAAARREAGSAFGDDRVFLERFMQGARHVEVQILGDTHGNIVHLFERECSIQRRHQKIIEESPSPALDDEQRSRLFAAAVAAGRAIGYTNAGTVEFVLASDGTFAFLEVNTRLQVEHPVTEAVTGADLVALQLLVAQGRPLPFSQEQLHTSGHAIEARLYAEDPSRDFLPAPGTIHAFEPGEPDLVRWDSGVRAGIEVSPFYDPMLAKVIAHADTREEAARLLARALARTHLHGLTTNRDLLVGVLEHQEFLAGRADTGFLETYPIAGAGHDGDRTVLDVAAVVAVLAHEHLEQASGSIPSGWRNNRSADQEVTFAADRDIAVAYRLERSGRWTVTVDDRPYQVERVRCDDRVIVLVVDDRRVRARYSWARTGRGVEWEITSALGHVALTELPRFPDQADRRVAGAAVAPMPGAVVTVAVAVGDVVRAGDLLCVVEAMKMEHRVHAAEAGVVERVGVAAGQQVDADQVLMVVEPASGLPLATVDVPSHYDD